jgi:hypothetical protein
MLIDDTSSLTDFSPSMRWHKTNSRRSLAIDLSKMLTGLADCSTVSLSIVMASKFRGLWFGQSMCDANKAGAVFAPVLDKFYPRQVYISFS